MTNLSSFFTVGPKGSLKFLRNPSLTYKGDWVQVFPGVVIDRWHVGEFSSASYLITVEFASNKKEVMHVNVIARPGQASFNVYGRTSIDDELVTINADVTNSWFELTVSPSDPIFTGAKLTFFATYGETINPLEPPVAVSQGGGNNGGGTGSGGGNNGGNTESGGGVASNSFSNIVVAGQSTVVADSSTDTLTLVAGSNVIISTNALTDTITISASAPTVTGLSSRATVAATTGILSSQESTTATVSAAKGYALYSIQVSAGAWVTVYTSATAQSNDSARSITTDPTPGSGVIAEAITTTATTTYFTPAVYGFNADGTTSTNAYLKIYNNSGSTQAITVTLTYLTLEV